MARLRKESKDSGDDIDAATTRPRTTNTTSRLRTSPRKRAAKSYVDSDIFQDDSESDVDLSKLVVKVPTDSARAKRQIKLAPLKASESLSELRQKIASPESSRRRPLKDVSGNGKEGGKLGLPLSRLNAFASRPSLKPSVVVDDDREEEAEVEESVWCGSDANSSGSEDELPSPRKLWPGKRVNASSAPKTASNSLDEALQGLQGLTIKESKKDVPRQPIIPSKKTVVPEERPGSSHSQDADSLDAILRFSPPRLSSRPRQRTPERPVTPPPASPSKSKLVSPSKTRTRIPTPPMRQSLDAFWSPNEVNEWNDKHSPRKAIGSPKKNPLLPSSESASPKSSPKKSSPTKRTQAEVQAKKDFAARKHALAESFLVELDDTITSGQVAALSASTGGVRILWSKTLNSTAGRANWRRETTRTRASPTAPATTTTQKHHASIELAEKVIDDEERLFNVLAHEFCHLANFMVSGIKDQPHGASFKAWGSKCTAAFASRGVHVTTKHSYQIDYKYVWRCSTEGCWAEFKRHSKSIDPLRHTCGSCKGKLLQIKPVPRGGAVPGGKVGGYAGFVKQHFADVKKSLPAGSSQKEVMEAVGRKYREEKERKAAEATTPKSGVDDLARALDVVVLDD
jgi:predicted SprT family Zn-dependent metalloprotease